MIFSPWTWVIFTFSNHTSQLLRFHKRDRGKIPSIAGEWQKWKLFDNPYFCHPPRNIFPFYHSPRKNIFPFAKSTEGSSFPWQGQRRLQAQYPVARGPACSLFGQGQVDTPNSRCKFAIFSKLRRGDSILVRAGRRTLTFACVYVFSREEVVKLRVTSTENFRKNKGFEYWSSTEAFPSDPCRPYWVYTMHKMIKR